jgi:hypothetical protein
VRTLGLSLCFAIAGILACAKPVTAPRRSLIPESVPSRLGPVPVVIVDSIRGPDSTQYLLGGFDTRARVIYLRRDLTPQMALLVFGHEQCHLDLADSGLHNLLHPKLADAICDAVGLRYAADRLNSKP